MHALTRTESRPERRKPLCGGASSPTASPKRSSDFQNSSEKKKKQARMKPAQQACLGSSRLLPVAAAAPCRQRPIPRRCRCSAEAPRAATGDDEVDEEPMTTTSQSSSSSPPPRPPPPDPEKRWRRLWGGNPHGVYRVPGVSDWFSRAPQVRVRSRTDRQVRGKRRNERDSMEANCLLSSPDRGAFCIDSIQSRGALG